MVRAAEDRVALQFDDGLASRHFDQFVRPCLDPLVAAEGRHTDAEVMIRRKRGVGDGECRRLVLRESGRRKQRQDGEDQQAEHFSTNVGVDRGKRHGCCDSVRTRTSHEQSVEFHARNEMKKKVHILQLTGRRGTSGKKKHFTKSILSLIGEGHVE